MRYERAGICQRSVLFFPEPDLEQSERAIPAAQLADEREGKSRPMDHHHWTVSEAPVGASNEKEYPKKVDNDDDMCEDSVDHVWPREQ